MSEAANPTVPPTDAPTVARPQASLIETVHMVADRVAHLQSTVEALNQSIQGTYQALAQIGQRLDERVDRIEAASRNAVDVNNEQTAALARELGAVNERLDAMAGRVDSAATRLDEVAGGPSITEVRDDLARVQHAMEGAVRSLAGQLDALSRALIG